MSYLTSKSTIRRPQFVRAVCAPGIRLLAVGVAAALLSVSSAARAVILHPESESAAVSPSAVSEPVGLPSADRPPADVVGRWGGNASAVAIGPNRIVTTNHQGGGDLTPVEFGGVQYRVRANGVHPIGDLDLRVVTIETLAGEAAHLADYVPIYDGQAEIGLPVAIGGFGRGRGASLVEDNRPYGYAWDLAADNSVQRWGRNQIDALDATTLFADFDDLGAPTSVFREAALSEFDSGGGWFVFVDGAWKLAGLSEGTERYGRSIFRANTADPDIDDPNDPNDFSGRDGADLIAAVRLSPYANDINTAMPEPGNIGMFCLFALGALGRTRRANRRGSHQLGAD